MASCNEQTISLDNEGNLINMTFKLLKSGEKEIELKNQYKEVVLVEGDTGTGKTTFCRWMTGDGGQLIAKETIEDSGDFIVQDIHGDANATITSDTVFPTLMVDIDNNVPYYDCPGFNDSRSVSNDIASTYFIKTVVDYADSVKILFVINYPSVRKGVDRHNFMKLMKHATELIKNVEKFENSVALIATKVDNIYKNGGKFFVDDKTVIATIADFLEEVKNECAVLFIALTAEKRRFYELAMKLISYFLKKDGEEYSNIGIFRRPDQSGFLDEVPLLLKGKEDIKRIVYRNLTFTKKVEEDFGYTISLESINVISGLVEEINKSVWHSAVHITDGIAEHFNTIINEMRKAIKSLHNGDLPPDADQLRAQELFSYLREGYEGLSNLIKDIESVKSPYSFAQKMKTLAIYLENFNFESDVFNIEKQGKYFDFLQVASKSNLNIRSWGELFKRAKTSISVFFKKLEEDIDEVALAIEKHILSFFNRISKDLQFQLDEKIKELRIEEIPVKLTIYGDSVMRMVEKCKNATSIKEYLKIIHNATHDMRINMPNDTALKIIKLEVSFKFLQNFREKNDFALSSEWIHPFQNFVSYLNEAKTWYSFLDSIYHIFSKYGIQKVKEKYNVTNLEYWGKSKARQGIFVTKTNFQHFIEKISKLNIADLDNIKNINLTGTRQEELNEVLNLTLKGQIKIDFQPPSAFLTGDYIRISDVINNPEISLFLKSETLKFLYIFASHTIFIDEDLILPGLGFVIIAQKWEIIGDRIINLDGTDGEIHSSAKANDGSRSDIKGKGGNPGLPGKPGGTFSGIGESFVNGAHLTITANGGNGSPGQHGGNGVNGKQGLDAGMPTPGDSPSQQEIQDGIQTIGDFACQKLAVNHIQGKGVFEVILENVLPSIPLIITTADYRIFGVPGSGGGAGGDGGKGGEGGNPGIINLIELNENSGIFKQCNRGVCGIDGKGGEGGLGGYEGKDIIVRCHMLRSEFLNLILGVQDITEWEFLTLIDKHNQEDSGRRGVDGANNRESLSPEPVNIVYNSSEIVDIYEERLLNNSTGRFKRLSLLSFLNKID